MDIDFVSQIVVLYRLEERNVRLMAEGAMMIYVIDLATCSATKFELAVSR
jgi:hypothetical protein